MPAELSQYGVGGVGEEVQCKLSRDMAFGLPGNYEANLQGLSGSGPGGGMYELLDTCQIWSITGAAWEADIPATNGTTNLVPVNQRCPSNRRPYLLAWRLAVNGNVALSDTSPAGIATVSLTDTNGYPAVVAPFSAFPASGRLDSKNCTTQFPTLLGESAKANAITTFLYNAAAATITAAAGTPFPTSAASAIGLVGAPVKIIDGTGKGQTATVKSCTTSVLTLNAPFAVAPADHASTAKDSVIAIYWQGVKNYTDTTHITIQNGGGSPFTANALDGYWVSVLAGTGAGQSRMIIANTTAGALTLNGALSTALDATSVIAIQDQLAGRGVVDMSNGIDAWASLQSGLQAVVFNAAGTTPLGSLIRGAVWGFWGP